MDSVDSQSLILVVVVWLPVHHIQNGSLAHPATHPVGTLGSFSVGKVGWSGKLSTPIQWWGSQFMVFYFHACCIHICEFFSWKVQQNDTQNEMPAHSYVTVKQGLWTKWCWHLTLRATSSARFVFVQFESLKLETSLPLDMVKRGLVVSNTGKRLVVSNLILSFALIRLV